MVRSHKKIILGSNSPRRRELLGGLDVEFTVDTLTSFEEFFPEGTEAHEVPVLMAMGKSDGFHRKLEDDEILITADTVVICGEGLVLGKPHSREQAVEMLGKLSGCTHEVVTAVVVRSNERKCYFTDSTLVTFEKFEDSEIDYYLDNYRPFDKAGSYGVQEWIGYVSISSLQGSFYNVMGFPVHKVYKALKEFGALD